MAIVSLPSVTWPSHWQTISGGPTAGGNVLSNVNDKIAIAFQAPRSGTVYQIGYVMQSVTANNNTTLTVEGVTTSTGLPDGVNLAGSNTAVTHTVGWNVKTPASSFSVTKGQWYVLVITNSGTASLSFRTITDAESFTYVRRFTASGSTWSAIIGGGAAVGLNYSNGGDDWDWPDPALGPSHSETSVNLSTSQTWDEAGIAFQVPVSVRVSGCLLCADVAADATVTLYDGSNNVLATGTYYSSVPPNTSILFNRVTFDTDVTLSANTTYRLTLKSTTTTTNVLYYWTATSATVLAQFCGNLTFTQRKSAGAWTDTNTARAYMHLLINGVDVPSSGGGGSIIGSSIILPGGPL